jgi:hypothetical protein
MPLMSVWLQVTANLVARATETSLFHAKSKEMEQNSRLMGRNTWDVRSGGDFYAPCTYSAAFKPNQIGLSLVI